MSADGIFIIDAVAHPYNFEAANYGDDRLSHNSAEATAELAWALVAAPHTPEYALPRSAYMSDWSVDDTAAMLFGESQTDVAVCHHLPIYAFKDGLVSIEKTAEAREKYPNRFVGAYAGVDPLRGKEAIASLEHQAGLFRPDGVKMYPTSWSGGTVRNFRMDDPEITYPILEKASEMGIKVAAIHKAVPIGPVPVTDAYGAKDVEGAATAFPDMNFEVVHGGLSFVEDTAWMMSRYPNVYINLEILNIVLLRRPRTFAKILIDLLAVGGAPVLKRLMWGTGTILHHPKPTIDAFLDFQFPEDLLDGAGMLGPIAPLTMEDKADILGLNYARMHGWDVEKLKANIGTDQFSRAAGEAIPAPYTTGSKAQEIQKSRLATV
jgi:predicted TIM-barrel fold metal-dependent hydrolase